MEIRDGYQGRYGYFANGTPSRVQAVADYFGPTDLVTLDRFGTTGPVVGLLGGPVQQKLDLAQQAGPVTFVTADRAPFIIVHGDSDKLVPIQQASISITPCRKPAGPRNSRRCRTPAMAPIIRKPSSSSSRSSTSICAEIMARPSVAIQREPKVRTRSWIPHVSHG